MATLFATGLVVAQEDHGYTPAEIQRGGQTYLMNCASCHGPDGDALPGVNLASGRFRHGTTDQDLIKIIRNGIAGTPMPPSNYTEAQAGTIVAYLRSMAKLAPAGRGATAAGDAARGKEIVNGKGQCLSCHRVNGNGAFLGPDLSSIGAARRRADLERALTDPSAEIRQDNQTVRAVRRDGSVLLGRLLNQDTYTVQLIDATGKLWTVEKGALREYEVMKTSAMTSYQSKLSAQEQDDVVSYLVTLKGGRR